MTVACGVDDRPALREILRGMRVGLITNHTGIDASHLPTAAVLAHGCGIQLERLFAPEHGLWGEIDDQDRVEDGADPATGLPVFSLYGASEEPSRADLKDLDALVFDIQDIGSRYYTFNWTMTRCMRAAAEARIRFVVLDRPNPVTGSRVEGNVSRREFASLVGLYPCAARHGMTSGEIALYVNGEFSVGADLVVIEMRGWRRDMWFDETGLTFVPPSPNATGLDMAALYPGACLFEGTNLSEGRGTTAPFEIIGSPRLDGRKFAAELNSRGLPGVWFRPTRFIPGASRYAGQRCAGVQVHVLDRDRLNSFETGLHMLCVARTMAPGFAWRNDPDGYSIDLLAGTDELRTSIDAGAGPDDLTAMWARDLDHFLQRRCRYLIYS
ncbi:MAG: DUF1343 domain-containing protein [Bacillota bacterium]